MSVRRIAACTALGVLSLAPCAPARAADAEVEELRRALMELRAHSQALERRIGTLEAELEAEQRRRRANGQRGVPAAPAPSPAPSARTPPPQQAETGPAPPGDRVEDQAQRDARAERLEQRVRELEITRAAQESATRSIIRDAISSVGSNINQNVALAGQIETRAARFRDFTGPTRELFELNSAQLEFDIKLSEWVFGSLLLDYDPGTNVQFRTITGFSATDPGASPGLSAGVDRINVDRATITIGDLQRFPIFLRAGRDVLDFGTSTGIARADTLSITGPLTIDAFETRRDAIGIGFSFPTPPLAPAPPPVVIPPVQPLVVAPLVSSMARVLGYTPPPARVPPLTPVPPPPILPPFYGTIYVFQGEPETAPKRGVTENLNLSLGYRNQGSCGRTYDELRGSYVCPWSFDFHVDYISSVYDSNFFRTEYRPVLAQLGTVPGVAASLKATAGPFAFTGEFNAATRRTEFFDDTGRKIRLIPAAWQVSLGYQFDWNPWVERIGEQGTFVALMYSGTRDLAGAIFTVDGQPTRVGFLPKERLALTAGEWVLPGVRLAAEVAVNWDYPIRDGGTGNTVGGFFTSLILAF